MVEDSDEYSYSAGFDAVVSIDAVPPAGSFPLAHDKTLIFAVHHNKKNPH